MAFHFYTRTKQVLHRNSFLLAEQIVILRFISEFLSFTYDIISHLLKWEVVEINYFKHYKYKKDHTLLVLLFS